MNNTAILYFTGTGNSLTASKMVCEAFRKKGHESSLFNINEIKNDTLEGYDHIGIIVPVYGLSLPKIVIEKLKLLSSLNQKRVFCITSVHSNPGHSEQQLFNILKQQKAKINGFLTLKLSSRAVIREAMDTEELEDKLFQKADSDINQFLDLYLSGHARKNPTQSSLKYKVIATLFRKIVGNMFGKMTVNDSCTSCGKCVQICPVNAIEMKKGIPKINSNCQGCARCIVFCPNKAMELMKSLDFNTRVLDDAQLYESIEGRRG